jgi:membrane-associated phospholipid phosphatase
MSHGLDDMRSRERLWHAGVGTRTMLLMGFVLVFAALPMFADKWLYDHFYKANLYDQDWARMLRVMGFLPTWIIAAWAMWLQGSKEDRSRARRRAWYLAIAPTAAGIGAEILKLLLRRERPEVDAGVYSFRQWSEQPFSTAGLAWPSSHTMVAFGAATALSRLYPRAKWVWFALAAGCGVTRVLSRAHFFSDAMLWGIYFVMRKQGEI